MSTEKITRLALLTAVALIIFVLEAQIPPLVPIPGFKLGLANIVTLFTMFALGRKEAFIVLINRLILGNIFTGQLLTFIYSLSGGLVSFVVISLLFHTFSSKSLWIPSIISAMLHNTGQIFCAAWVLGTSAVFAYLPILLISGTVTGLFTGLVAQYLLQHNAIMYYLHRN